MRMRLRQLGLAAAALILAYTHELPHARAQPSLDGDAAAATQSDVGAPPSDKTRNAESIVDIGAQIAPLLKSDVNGEAEATVAAPGLPACAADPSRLGLARVVEVDAAGGPEFGGQTGRKYDFLQDKEVVLTFDDGPMRSHTRKVLEALAAQCTRATFFMVGRMAAADPDMVKEVLSQGHTAATHTWSHKNLRTTTGGRALQEFEMGVSAVARASGGTAAPFFRFPYLSENSAILKLARERNIATFWIDIDSKDYLTRNAHEVQRRVMAQLNAKGKGIILMHDIQLSTVGAIAPLLDELHLRGYKVVHVVPKTPVTSVAAADAAVAKVFGDKAKALSENPLADRSVVWAADPVEPAATKRAPGGRKSAKQKTAAPATNLLPWLQPLPADNDTPSNKLAPHSNDQPPLHLNPSTY